MSIQVTEIVTAVQRGSQVYVYGPNQRQLCSVFARNGPNGGLKGSRPAPSACDVAAPFMSMMLGVGGFRACLPVRKEND